LSHKCLRKGNWDIAVITGLYPVPGIADDIQRLHVEHSYSIQLAPDGQIQRFTYQIDKQHQLEVERRYETFIGHLEPIPYW
jgi:hypothetical protein